MSKKLYEERNIESIADAIREQNGTQTTYRVADMPVAIRNIVPVGDFIPLDEKGAAEGVAELDANGKVPEEQLPEIAPFTELTWAQYEALSEAEKNNGTYYSIIDKDNVPGGVIQPLTVTQNGTYNPPSGVDGFAPITVNVSGGEPSLPTEYKRVEYLTTDASTYTYAYIPFYQLVGDRLKFKAKADWTKQTGMATGGLKSSYDQISGYRANFNVRSSYRSLWADGGAVEVLTSDPTVRASDDTVVTYGEMLSPNDLAEIDITFDSTTTSIMNIFYGSYASKQWAPSTDLYELFVFRADGNTAIHLVPCVRIADSVCGFYDLQTSVFCIAAHGSFTAGPDVN